MNLNAENSLNSEGTEARRAAFWKRYERLLEEAGIAEKRRPWFQKDCERFIAWLEPTRLRRARIEELSGSVMGDRFYSAHIGVARVGG